MPREDDHPFGAQGFGDEGGDLIIFLGEDAGAVLDLRHLGAQAGEGLGQFGADRAAADDGDAAR